MCRVRSATSSASGHKKEGGALPVGNGEFLVVHNGIITNASALRHFLTARGSIFESETDTEVPGLVYFDPIRGVGFQIVQQQSDSGAFNSTPLLCVQRF